MHYHAGETEKPNILVLTPTWVSAVNVSGNTGHLGLGIVGNFRNNIQKTSVI